MIDAMQRITLKRWQRHTLWLSLLGHLLMLLGLTTALIFSHPPLPSAAAPAAISSYITESPPVAPAEVAPAPAEQMVKPTPEVAPPVPQAESTTKNKDPLGLLKPVAKKETASKKQKKQSQSVPQFSNHSPPEDLTNPYDEEPLHLIGESKIVPPLIKILARALSRHLFYPRVAAEFNLRGVVLVGFVLHPEGYVTGAKVVKSSGAGVLDDAARDAVGAMSPIGDVHEFVGIPEFMVVGIIFG